MTTCVSDIVVPDATATWHEYIDRSHGKGPWPDVASLGHALAILCLDDGRTNRTRARLTLNEMVVGGKPEIIVQSYRQMSWGNDIHYRIEQSVADELLASPYLTEVPQGRSIFPPGKRYCIAEDARKLFRASR